MRDSRRFQAHEDEPEPSTAYLVVYGVLLALVVLAILIVSLSWGQPPR